MNKRCRSCYYFGMCTSSKRCDDYTPIREEDEEMIDEFIEDERIEFYKEWFTYIEED